MSDSTRPLIIYKYFEPSLIKVMENNTLRATQIDALNDPFELLPDYTELESSYFEPLSEQMIRQPNAAYPIDTNGEYAEEVRKQTSNANRQAADSVKRHVRNSCLVTCFSETNNNLLMWSHYARSHKGFVLGFDANHPFFFGSYVSNLSRLFRVAYDTDRVRYPQSMLNIKDDEFMSIMLRKSIDWRYEKEWRMFAKIEACRTAGKVDHYELYLLDWPPELLTDIILGSMITIGDKSSLMRLRADRYPRAELFEAKLSPTKYDLSIDPMF